MKAKDFLPFEVVFNPNWWHRTAGISFERPFYFDAAARVANDVTMRRVLHQRFGDIGLGEADPQPRPVAGSLHVAGGFVIPALLGAEDPLFGRRSAPAAAGSPDAGGDRPAGEARLPDDLADAGAHRRLGRVGSANTATSSAI